MTRQEQIGVLWDFVCTWSRYGDLRDFSLGIEGLAGLAFFWGVLRGKDILFFSAFSDSCFYSSFEAPLLCLGHARCVTVRMAAEEIFWISLHRCETDSRN